MSFAEPVKIIDHIPKDFDMKAYRRHRGQVKPARKTTTKAQPAKAPEPSSFKASKERAIARAWKITAFIGALAIIVGALITGAWTR